MIIKLTIINTKSRFIFKTATKKFDNDATFIKVFEAKDVLPQDIVEVRGGKSNLKFPIRQVKSTRKFLQALKTFHNFLLFVFI